MWWLQKDAGTGFKVDSSGSHLTLIGCESMGNSKPVERMNGATITANAATAAASDFMGDECLLQSTGSMAQQIL